ncbi:MAG: 4-alpha-glucanotransferase, partial [Defluviitaleaceae bacterium]|nr:4-alpha-glucanotransferase [Defluviitaleaceae bacterium]
YYSISEKEKDIFRRYLNSPGNNPSWDMIRLAYSSTADFCIIPIQDIFEENSDKRMNVPGNKSGNWQYRYKEDMITKEIKDKLLYLSKLFNRY